MLGSPSRTAGAVLEQWRRVAPCATATGGPWFHAPPQEKTGDKVDLVRLLSFFLSSPTVKITVTCNQKKTHRQSVLVNFLDLFSSTFHPYLLHFLLSQVCSWGFAIFSSVSGGRSGDAAVCRGRRWICGGAAI